MRRLAPATLVGFALLMAGNAASALGLGRVSTLSYLGNPLEFTVGVTGTAADVLSPDCISAEVLAGDTRVPPEMVRVRVNRTADGTPTSLRLVTGMRIDEPIASVELVLDCGTRITRRYVVFVDPPLVTMAQAASDDVGIAAVTPPRRTAAAREGGSAPRRARSSRAGEGSTVQAGGTGTASAARQRRVARAEAARAARAAAPAAETGARLKLESAPSVRAGAPVKERTGAVAPSGPGAASAPGTGLAVGGTAIAAAAAAAASGASLPASAASAAGGLVGELAAKAEADALALATERMKALEERMTRLVNDNKSMQKSVQELQAQLARAEAGRYANPLVYGLVAALVVLLAAVLGLLWRQSNMRRESDWMKAAAADSGLGEARSEPKVAVRSIVTPSTSRAAQVPAVAAAAAASTQLVGEETAPSATLLSPSDEALDKAPPVGGAVVGDASAAAPVGAHESTSVFDPRREVSVEELIDLEQQADFFVVLGQDDAAIDLLMGHVQGTGGASPLPYLKLLEIHRRRDEREAYDRVRERFNRRFGAFAPEWDDHSGHDRPIDAYPGVIERLQVVWPEPAQAMEALAGLLFQRDPTAPTFDLPAYGELLFLYSLSRERAEHEPPTDGVDLLLPLDDGPQPTGARSAAAGMAGAAVGVAGAAVAAQAADSGGFGADPLSLDDLPDGPLPERGAAPTYPVPLSPDARGAGGRPDIGTLDLNINDEPEEPKGPLSKW